MAFSVARPVAVRLAKRDAELGAQLKINSSRITGPVEINESAPLLQDTGFAPVTAAAVCRTAWSHRGRAHSEAAVASLAGASPIPASSGNTVRNWLDRGGDRTPNKALPMLALSRMTFATETIGYVQKRQAEGQTKRRSAGA